jgi:hypothetical protein
MRERLLARLDRRFGETASQAVGQNSCDFDLAYVAQEWEGAIDMDRLEIGTAPNGLAGFAPWLLEQHRKRAARTTLVECLLLFGQQGL